MKRLVAVCLCLCLVAGCLFGCSTNGKTPSASSTGNTANDCYVVTPRSLDDVGFYIVSSLNDARTGAATGFCAFVGTVISESPHTRDKHNGREYYWSDTEFHIRVDEVLAGQLPNPDRVVFVDKKDTQCKNPLQVGDQFFLISRGDQYDDGRLSAAYGANCIYRVMGPSGRLELAQTKEDDKNFYYTPDFTLDDIRELTRLRKERIASEASEEAELASRYSS